MMTVTVNAHGHITFSKAVLQHLGIKAGEKLALVLLPDGLATLKANRQTGTIADFIGVLSSRTKKVASLEEINRGN